MEIIAAILGALVAVLIGAYINHVFDWRIKGKIEALDRMYENLFNLRGKVAQFVKMDEKSSQLQLADCEFLLSGIVLQNEILDKKFEAVTLKITDSLTKLSDSEYEEDKTKQHVQIKEFFGFTINLCTEIIDCRKKITSFPYMLKELFCNWWCGIAGAIIVTIFFCWLFFHCCNSTSSAVQVIRIFIN